jgi:hypothetical protein
MESFMEAAEAQNSAVEPQGEKGIIILKMIDFYILS